MINEVIDNGDGTSTIVYDDGSTLVVDENGIFTGNLMEGTEDDDRLIGTQSIDYMFSYEGDDILIGKDGGDVMDGGAGSDMLLGGKGNDTLIFDVQENLSNPAGSLNFYDGGSDVDTLVIDITFLSTPPEGFATLAQYRQALIDFFNAQQPLSHTVDFRLFNDGGPGALELNAKNFEAIQVWTPPVAEEGNFILNEDNSSPFQLSFSDPDGDVPKVHSINGQPITMDTPFALASGALITISANGHFTYDPNDQYEYLAVNEIATDSFTYTVKDDDGGTSTATVTMTIEGRNDTPIINNAITTGTVTEVADGLIQENAVEHTQNGNIAFGDVDLSNQHTLTKTLISANDSLNGVVAARGVFNVNMDDLSTGDGSGNVQWTFNVDDAALDDLAQGQTLTQVYEVKIDDGFGGTASQQITITLIGTNDQPIIGAFLATGAVNEIADGLINENAIEHVQNGYIAFSDVDLADAHTVSQTLLSANDSLNGVAAARGLFNVNMDNLATGDGSGNIQWTFNINDAALDDLAQGQTLTQVYEVKIDDGQGGIASQQVTITLTGTNDQPVIGAAVSTGAVFEIADGLIDENAVEHTQNGNIDFGDVDLADAHTVSQTLVSANDSLNGAVAGRGIFSVNLGDHSTGDGAGSVQWHYKVNDAALDELAQGQVLTQVYNVSIDDGHGGVVNQQVTITITGTNDKPVIGTAVSTGAVFELADGLLDENAIEHVQNGQIAFGDVDLADAHTVSQTLMSANDSLNGAVAARGIFSVNLDNHSTGDGAGNVQWSYKVDDAALDDLAEGQTLTQVYEVKVDDGQGGIASQFITITITGSNDAAVITNTDASFNLQLNNLSTFGTVNSIDVDNEDNTFLQQDNIQGSYGVFNLAQDGIWSYQIDQVSYDALALYQEVNEEFNIQSYDGTSALFSINLTRVADLEYLEAVDLTVQDFGFYVNNALEATVSQVDYVVMGSASDKLTLHQLAVGSTIFMGEDNNLDNDVVDIHSLSGYTYQASSGLLSQNLDPANHFMTIHDVETFNVVKGGNTLILDADGTYSVHIAQETGLTEDSIATTIKLVEGYATQLHLDYAALTEVVPYSELPKVILQMEFNNGLSNPNNIALLDFAAGQYVFNATAIEHGLLNNLYPLTIDLTSDNTITGPVTAEIVSLRDYTVETSDFGLTEVSVGVLNSSGQAGIVDLSQMTSDLYLTPIVSPFFNPLGTHDLIGLYAYSGSLDTALLEQSNFHSFMSFTTLFSGSGNDILDINPSSFQVDYVFDMGAGNDVMDIRSVSDYTYQASSGLLSQNIDPAINMTIHDIETFNVVKGGNTFILDADGTYTVKIAQETGLTVDSIATTIKLVEGYATQLNLEYAALTEVVPYSELPKVILQMEFNNGLSNPNNIALLDFAAGQYSFNAVAVDWSLINQYPLTIDLTSDNTITGPVTAEILSLRDYKVETSDFGLTEVSVAIVNSSGQSGIVDLSQMTSNLHLTPIVSPLFNPLGTHDFIGLYAYSGSLDTALLQQSSFHSFMSFTTLFSGSGNDILEINGTSVQVDFTFDMGAGNDVMDIRALSGYTYQASSGLLSQNIDPAINMTIHDIETFNVVKGGNTFILDADGTYTVKLAQETGLTDASVATTIKLVEGYATQLNLDYAALTEVVPFNELPKVILQMEFNNGLSNPDNVALLDFAAGQYSFNASAAEYAAIWNLYPLTIDLTSDNTITGPVTAEIVSLRDYTVETTSGFTEPFVSILNSSGQSGIVDLSQMTSNLYINPFVSPLFNPLGTHDFIGVYEYSGSLDSALLEESNLHSFMNFTTLHSGSGNDILAINQTSFQVDYIFDMGAGNDTFDASLLGAAVNPLTVEGHTINGIAFDMNSGLLQYDDKQMTVLNTEVVVGSIHDDWILGHDSQQNQLDGGLGNDILTGGAALDILMGGEGNDILTGGGGDDSFIFGPNSAGMDTIMDFEGAGVAGGDVIDLQAYDLQGVYPSYTDNGTDTTINLSPEDTITLIGVTGLTNEDFII